MTDPQPTLYEIFDETNLEFWRPRIESGIMPDSEQLAALLDQNWAKPLPSWLRPVVLQAVRGKLKAKRGRPARSLYYQVCLSAAIAQYERLLKQAVRARKGANRAGAVKTPKGRTREPLHERLAEQVVSEWKLPISWKSFLNEISSRK
ncbi:hypothetical protein [Bradyrhizobium sp. USDA 4486]